MHSRCIRALAKRRRDVTASTAGARLHTYSWKPDDPPDAHAVAWEFGERVSLDYAPDAACIREARADRLGVLESELLAWRSPPFADGAMLLARDLGPAGNAWILHKLTRKAYLFIDSNATSGPTLLDYADGMELLWGGAAVGSEGR